MEEEGSSILLKSLESSGVQIPAGVSSIKDLSPPTFFAICICSLCHLITTNPNPNLIDHQTWLFQFANDEIDSVEKYYTSSSMPDRLKICSELAAAVSAIGFTPQITFQSFLYPSEKDYYKLLRFFVKELSELPQVPATSSNNQTIKPANGQAELKPEELMSTLEHDTLEKLKKLKVVELEIEAVTDKREQLCKLIADIETQPKVISSRKSYIERITNITNNSRKQDLDIERILKDTRALQLESNYIQQRLNRTYAVVDEIMFREAEKDPAKQAYRLLTGIHESFQQISDKILSTDRIRRETTEYEAKLSALSRQSFNVEKLQVDLDAIRRENEFLERSI